MTNKSHYIFAILATTLLFTTGCTIIRSEPSHDISFEDTDYSIETTHYREILHEHGPPSQLSALGTGMVWLYEEVDLTEKQLGIGFSDGPLSLFKINLAAGDGEYKGWMLTFGENGYVTSFAKTEDVINLGRGAGFQFILTVSSLVNITDVRGSSAQADWGQGLITEPSRGLNRNQDLNLGKSGLQLLMTPAYTGQHTLAKP